MVLGLIKFLSTYIKYLSENKTGKNFASTYRITNLSLFRVVQKKEHHSKNKNQRKCLTWEFKNTNAEVIFYKMKNRNKLHRIISWHHYLFTIFFKINSIVHNIGTLKSKLYVFYDFYVGQLSFHL